MRKLILLVLWFLFLTPKTAFAIEDPLSVPNNKFGIHIMDENSLNEAAELINSSGGDWGYVTIVIRKDERKVDRWQRVFEEMRRHHLIPIVRIASNQGDGYWEKLQKDDIDSWVYFLNSLNWVTKNRYISVGNETNHSTEWGGEINPEEYASYLIEFTKKIKESSDDFFVLQGGFDASAPSDDKHMEEEEYITRMISVEPDVFEIIDGWSSHSYPNPGFQGSVDDLGRGSIRTYQWEMQLLENLGLNKKLPIFITETGWIHDANGKYPNMEEGNIAENIVRAFKDVWNDDSIVAVTPFVLEHNGEPFDKFSWIEGGNPTVFFHRVKEMEKIKGEPKQITDGTFISILIPEILSKNLIISTFSETEDTVGLGVARNTGQTIWEKGKPVKIKKGVDEYYVEPLTFDKPLEPIKSGLVIFSTTYGQEKNIITSLFKPLKNLIGGNQLSTKFEIFAQE